MYSWLCLEVCSTMHPTYCGTQKQHCISQTKLVQLQILSYNTIIYCKHQRDLVEGMWLYQENLPVIILGETHESAILQQLLDEGFVLFIRAVTHVDLVWLANGHLLVDELLYGGAQITDLYARGAEFSNADGCSHLAVAQVVPATRERKKAVMNSE